VSAPPSERTLRVQRLERGGARLLECTDEIAQLDDALALVSACIEHGSHGLLIHAQNLPPAFFALHSRFAGEFLQKFQNYRIRLAIVIADTHSADPRFAEFLSEAKRGHSFRAFAERSAAEAWLSAS
jgi:hypothetical protein